MKNDRSGKCETNYINAKCEKSVASCMTSQMVSLDNLVSMVSFVVIFGFRGVNIPKLKILGSVLMLRENVKC